MYSKIVLCLSEKEDDLLAKQIAMLKERHHAEVLRISASDAAGQIPHWGSEVLFISENEDLLAQAKARGLSTNDPRSMKESYTKAMEMLKALGVKGTPE